MFQLCGAPTDEEKRALTQVLQGHVAIGNFDFPNWNHWLRDVRLSGQSHKLTLLMR